MVFKLRKRVRIESAPQPRFDVLASVRTNRGCVRESNEDAGSFFQPSDAAQLEQKGVLALVADGMGGHLAGEVASKLAVEIIQRVYYRERQAAPKALITAFMDANRQIHEASLSDETLAGMGTTCTALVLLGGMAFVAHVGDSRLYMMRDGEIYLMTEDHSVVMEMVRQGIIGLEEARSHADKNVILRALGTNPQVEVSTWDEPLPVRAGDHFLLCSDGLYDLVEDAEIKDILTVAEDAHAACERLVELARLRGGHDNITVCLVSLKPDGQTKARAARVTRELKRAE